MSIRHNFSDEQLEQMAEWREGGKSYAWIGRRMGCSPGLVRWNCLKVGADDPKGPSRAPSKMPMLTMRSGFPIRRFSSQEDETLLSLRNSGRTLSQIGRQMGRRTNSLKGRLLTLAMHDQRREAVP